MERPRRRARRQASKRLAPFYRMTFLILIGAIAARLIILGIDALGSRTGLPGGEIFIPVYIIPSITKTYTEVLLLGQRLNKRIIEIDNLISDNLIARYGSKP